ncbi:MAG: ribosome-associated translation inhibitor RaiA [Bacteroidetes bacterium]|jgi:ribosomal subunit interface protein|nr:ribosome-associated translation inhibitor RaiA [Bacteroidota bacterium]
MTITFQATNLSLTDDLRTYVEDKLADCLRPLQDMNLDPVSVDVELERTTFRHPHAREDQRRFRAEANVTVPGRRLIRAEGSADDLRQAIVQMKHVLTRDLRRWHERLIAKSRQGAREAKALLSEADVTSIPEVDVVEEWLEVEEDLEARSEQAADDAWQLLDEDGADARDFV